MPFIMAPLMWARLSAGFRKPTILRERAHGDGLDIGYDSPEAFEEVIWHTFWPDHYGADGIRLWSKDDVSDEARVFMERHFHKIVALRGRDRPATRYLSKNNGNIARLGLILAMFPDAHVVVPVRHPAAHAGSLHRQHLNFLAQHAADTFTARYMRDIGHFEFGALHRPILFDGFAERADGMSPAELDYWLTYWISAFSHLSRFKDRVHVVGYEALCNGGEAAAARLCSAVGLPPAHSGRLARHFRAVEPAEWPEGRHAPALRDEAAALYETFIS
ncbi:hypothetical protein C882_1192 [Caenispirillum salinarum AK4]|uniref:Sulfotransferase family protein n=2 Tax=Caenispirillum TaxID=414051 RepID=K9HHW1_9PROT|nr:hypothetical protein C882_1192 [Caenispirillum salinarum AK4]